MNKSLFILLILVLFSLQSAIAQLNTDQNSKQKPKIKRDTTKVDILIWKLEDDLISKKYTKFDTSYDMAHIYIPFYQTNISNSFLGNYGQAGKSNIFVQPLDNSVCFFNRYYSPYIIKAEDIAFYNTNKPYANIIFNTSTKITDQQTLDVLYTQNITPVLNFGFKVNGYISKGSFAQEQTSGAKLAAFTSYEGKYYNLYVAFANTSLSAQVNGGVIYDELQSNLSLLPVLLTNATVNVRKRMGLLVQTLSLGRMQKEQVSDTVSKESYFKPWVQITHQLQYDRDTYAYQDKDATKAIIDSSYYISSGGNTKILGYVPTKFLYDSIYFRKIENKLQIRFNEDWNSYFKIGLRGGVFHELYDIYNFKFDYTKDNSTDRYSTAGVYAGLFNHKSQTWEWDGNVKYFMTGYYQNNFELKANLNKTFRFKRDSLLFKAEFISLKKKPDYFEQTFHSDSTSQNWNNGFQDKIESYISGEISNPKHLFSAGIKYGLFNNFIYMDSTSKPSQFTNSFSVMTLYLNKTLRLWRFRVAGRLAYQLASTNKPVSLPKIATFGALYYEDLLFKVLYFQLGGDVYYHSSFYQPSFTPLTSQFYEQRSLMYKDLPTFDVFLNIRIKRAVVYLKFENIIRDYNATAYFPLEKYPVESLLFKYGVTWQFHN